MSMGIRNPKVQKENHDCSKYYQNHKLHKDNPIRKDNDGRLATIPNFREYARLRKWVLHLFYRTVYKNPHSLEKGSKKLLLAVSGNR
jgi:hypothetical protein